MNQPGQEIEGPMAITVLGGLLTRPCSIFWFCQRSPSASAIEGARARRSGCCSAACSGRSRRRVTNASI
jgi:hypothetical protein